MTAPAPPAPRHMLEDPVALHQIVLLVTGNDLAVSCTCLARSGRHGGRLAHDAIEIRRLFPAAEAVRCWRAWHAERAVTGLSRSGTGRNVRT